MQAAEATTMAGPRQSRRAAKAPRRGGLVAALATALVVGVGAGAVALTNMSSEGVSPPVDVVAAPTTESAAVTDDPSPSRVPTARPGRQPKPTVSTGRRPPRQDPTPTPDKTKTPTPTPTPSPKPTKTPTPTPSPKPKKPVPYVVDLPFPQADSMLKAAGFGVYADDQSGGTVKKECLKVAQSWPDGGEDFEVGKKVKVVLIPIEPCGQPTPSATITPGPNKQQ